MPKNENAPDNWGSIHFSLIGVWLIIKFYWGSLIGWILKRDNNFLSTIKL